MSVLGDTAKRTRSVTLPAWWQKSWWGRAEGAAGETGGWRPPGLSFGGPGEAEAAGMTAGSNISRAWKSADCLVALTWAQGQTREFREAPDTLRCLEQRVSLLTWLPHWTREVWRSVLMSPVRLCVLRGSECSSEGVGSVPATRYFILK